MKKFFLSLFCLCLAININAHETAHFMNLTTKYTNPFFNSDDTYILVCKSCGGTNFTLEPSKAAPNLYRATCTDCNWWVDVILVKH